VFAHVAGGNIIFAGEALAEKQTVGSFQISADHMEII
jgi:hypothetical protein